METQKFIDGFYANKPHEKAPAWKVCELKWDNKQLKAFLEQQLEKGEQYTRMDVLKNKDGNKYYAQINNWKPEDKRPDFVQDAIDEKEADEAFDAITSPGADGEVINVDDIPFN